MTHIVQRLGLLREVFAALARDRDIFKREAETERTLDQAETFEVLGSKTRAAGATALASGRL